MPSSAEANYIIGIDIGGTKIATGLVNCEFHVVERTILPTPRDARAERVLEQIYRSVDAILQKSNITRSDITGIGVVAPGPLNPDAGVVISAPNIPAFKDIPIVERLQGRFGFPTRLENDANAAGLAEALFGSGVGCDHVFYTTVSTGIGTGIVINRRIYHGKNGTAAEGGHVTIDFRGPVCSCGRRGCIEAYASGPALARRAKERLTSCEGRSRILDLVDGDLERVTPVEISRAAEEGDPLAIELISETGEYLAIWLGGMVSLLDPDIVVIGGGLSLMGERLFSAIRERLPTYSINPFAKDVPVVPARLQRDVGILGAAALFLEAKTDEAPI